VLVLSCISFYAHAQSNSPYSRFGIGDLLDDDNLENRGSAGASVNQVSDRKINTYNPATLSSLKITGLQFGLVGARSSMATAKRAINVGSFNISNFVFAMPLKPNAGVAIGLQPFSRVNYGDTVGIYSPEDSGKIGISHFGGGGTQRVYGAFGYTYKNLSVGINAGYIFGGYTYSSENSFLEDTVAYSMRYINNTYVRGVHYTLGINYAAKLNKDLTLRAGAVYTPTRNLRATRDKLYTTPYLAASGLAEATDTISGSYNEIGKVVLPGSVALGASIGKDLHWRISVDATQSRWSNYRSYEQVDSTGDSYRLKVGWAYVPAPTASNKNFWSKVEYRLGFYTGNDIYKLRGKSIRNSAFTAGLGLPFRSYRANVGTFNCALQVGRRGTIDDGLFRDSYTRFSFGVSLNAGDWFIKRRYD
jgi:hypothetical protein